MKKRLRVSVRGLVEHCLRSGDLNLESWGPSSSSSLGDAIRAHQKVQSSRGEGYRKEVTLSHVVENDLFALEIGGRIDGVLTRDTGVIIEEIKTTTGDLDARAARPGSFGFAPTHWGQLQVYAYNLRAPKRSRGSRGTTHLFVSDTHLGFDLPRRPRVERRRRGPDFFENFERALEPAHDDHPARVKGLSVENVRRLDGVDIFRVRARPSNEDHKGYDQRHEQRLLHTNVSSTTDVTMLTIRDKQTMSEKEQTSTEEPFLLTILPFVGLGLLLVLAVVWRVLPGRAEEPGEGPSTASPEEIATTVIARWEQAPTRDIPIEAGRDFILGPEDARVTLVEFSDFECPYCRNAANGVHDIMEKFDGDVRLVFKNFPLDVACNQQMKEPMHRLACKAATLAWCAGPPR